MRVVVLYQAAGEDSTVEDRDVLVQRDAVAAALQRLGHRTSCLGCTLDLAAAKQQLSTRRPDIVFNLVESLGGTDRLMPLATLLLDALQIPYTGNPTEAILATSNKLIAKERLCQASMPTPAWLQNGGPNRVREVPADDVMFADALPPRRGACAGLQVSASGAFDGGANDDIRWILKPVLEHASFGLDDDAVVTTADLTTLATLLRAREQRVGRPLFAEQFIEGREFNLSLLNEQVLPPAEIDFSSFPDDKPRIVGHQAKWDESSFEYQQTPRRFDFPATDALLLAQISEFARKCWQLFELSGYARVDFRVDRDGRAWILEVNANPCLSPDAGFAAALSKAGITYDAAIQRMIESSMPRSSEPVESSRQPISTASVGRR